VDDEFMLSALRAPRPALVRQVRERLRRVDAGLRRSAQRRTAFRAVAYAASLLLAVGLFTLPSVRAGAEAFLDLFRVVSFAPVAVPRERVESLMTQQGLDLAHMIGEQVHVVKAPGRPQTVATPEAAGALAGIRVRLPAWQPVGLALEHVDVSGDQVWTVTASSSKLQRALDAFGIEDLSVPQGIDGQTATIHVPPVVRITYVGESRHVLFIQARQPEASLPPGADLARLAEIGLRVLGLGRAEAYRFAQNVDWRTTLLVPVPADVSSFRKVDIQGGTGLLIEMAPQAAPGRVPRLSQLLWSSGGSVLALVGNAPPDELFEMAESVQ
jgi:hypothetical protein